MGKLIIRIPGSSLLTSSLPGSALRKHVESVGKRGKLDTKDACISLLAIMTYL